MHAAISLPFLFGNGIANFIYMHFLVFTAADWFLVFHRIIWHHFVLNNGRIILCAAGFYVVVLSMKFPSLQILPVLGAQLMYVVTFFGLLFFQMFSFSSYKKWKTLFRFQMYLFHAWVWQCPLEILCLLWYDLFPPYVSH